MDVKRLVRFHAPGHALTGVRTKDSRGAGWEYVHSIVDDCSRLAYSEVHADERAQTVTDFTRRALDWFLEQGVVCERLMTDNAFAYTNNRSLARLLRGCAIRHIRIRPYTPSTNGKVERFNQTLQREWAYALEYASSAARRAREPLDRRRSAPRSHAQRAQAPTFLTLLLPHLAFDPPFLGLELAVQPHRQESDDDQRPSSSRSKFVVTNTRTSPSAASAAKSSYVSAGARPSKCLAR